MRTQGEIEAAVCKAIVDFERDFMGRGPRDCHAHLMGTLIVIRLKEVLTEGEKQLAKSLPPAKGRDLLKSVRTQLIESARPVLDALIENCTGVKSLSMHHDISTVTGEKVLLFTLSDVPLYRESKRG